MRSLIVITALAVLAGCAESPTKTTTTGGPSSGSGKIVTTTPEDSYECDDDLILEPHQPEECIPPEPPEPVVQKPVEPAKPDPLIGTYQFFYTTVSERRGILRVYSNNRASVSHGRDIYRWEKEGDVYHFYMDTFAHKPESYQYSTEYTDLAGEPHLKSFGSTSAWRTFEAVKLSGDPDYLFDHFQLTALALSRNKWECVNIGRKQKGFATLTIERSRNQPDFADSLEECEALCPEAVQGHPKLSAGQSCPQDRR